MALKSAFSGFSLSFGAVNTLAKTGQKQGVFCKNASQMQVKTIGTSPLVTSPCLNGIRQLTKADPIG